MATFSSGKHNRSKRSINGACTDRLCSWQHGQMNNIAKELGVDDADNYPEGSYDVIWTIPSPYEEIKDEISENCPGLDD